MLISGRIGEILPLPGVMDPAAQTVEDAVRELTGVAEVQALTGVRYDFEGITRAQADEVARRLLFNPAIQGAHPAPHCPGEFPRPRAADQTLRHVTLRERTDDELNKLSREGHLFLSLDEMKAIQAEYRRIAREPTDVELETLAQTWSEHCVHKTLKSRIIYREQEPRASASGSVSRINWHNRPGHTLNPDGSVTIDNLLKRTVAAATFELIQEGVDWTLSVFKDNSGVIRFDDTHAVCIKVETHNHPSAIEPYGGAATGVGGCIRDVIATGLGAQPIANTDVFCVAYPDDWTEQQGNSTFDAAALSRREAAPYALPKGVLAPRYVLSRVVDGVRDYGNRMGIPTVSGAVYFDNRYVGNPLVFCGCIGLMRADMVHGGAKPGDRIIALGGRTGRDGIHGATFSSAELTDTHADEFSHAVQIGNAIEEKRTLDAIIRARDYISSTAPVPSAQCPVPSPLFHGLTDCGAGGFSSAIGEMGSKLGAEVHLERAPLKYAGLRYDEIWISESQERFILAVPPENVAALQKICDEEGVLLADLGHFGTNNAELILNFQGKEVARMSMHFLHEGIPMPTREAVWSAGAVGSGQVASGGEAPASLLPCSAPLATGHLPNSPLPDLRTRLLQLLAHPNIASKRWIVRQYDHEVRGNTIQKPLVGPGGIGPGDATVIQPVPGSKQGLAIACGMAVHLGDPINNGDPYEAALAAVDECVRNLVCVGADPDKIAILDNFCWPSCGKSENLASLVRAAEGCYDAAKAYRTPFVSGKDSLNNQLRLQDGRVIEIPPTLLITGMGIVPDVTKCVTMDLKSVGPDQVSNIALIGVDFPEWRQPDRNAERFAFNLQQFALAAKYMHRLIQEGAVMAVHDASEGGALLAVAEMLIAGRDDVGLDLWMDGFLAWQDRGYIVDSAFAEMKGLYVVQLVPEWSQGGPNHARLWDMMDDYQISELKTIGRLNVASAELSVRGDGCNDSPPDCRIATSDLRQAFLGTLNW
ncbi:MAG: phosphoribosylformylglycinamidine synthase subunit PurS [Planctomycetes bacterium]|nr:phosphoribosylformylglycinamidine synthase subunit PurS [Planctomycetota bacterium]